MSNRRWIVGIKLCLVVNQRGLVVEWDTNTANHNDTIFRPLVESFEGEMVVLTDGGFHTKLIKGGDPANMKVCQPDTWNERMIIERVFAMLTAVCHLKKIGHRAWSYVRARLAFVVAAFNLLVQWNGLTPDENGIMHLSIAQFSL